MFRRLLVVGVAVGVVLGAVSCGSKKTMQVETPSPLVEFTRLANEKYSDHYWGIGEGVSNREGMASSIAAARAREAIVLMMQTSLSSKLKTVGVNSVNLETSETTMLRLVQETQGILADARQREIRVLHNPSENQYTVYVLMSVPVVSANNAFRRELAANQAIIDANTSKELMGIIDSGLDN